MGAASTLAPVSQAPENRLTLNGRLVSARIRRIASVIGPE
jgi:hypothetical protein